MIGLSVHYLLALYVYRFVLIAVDVVIRYVLFVCVHACVCVVYRVVSGVYPSISI